MRDRSGWHRELIGTFTSAWPRSLGRWGPGDLLDVELGLYLLETVTPARTAADVWPLLGGYPYAEALGDVRSDEQRLRIRRARHYLWDIRRRRDWRLAVETYLHVPQELRGYDLDGVDAVPVRRSPSVAAHRFDRYEQLLTSPPPFVREPLPTAGVGEYTFPVRDRRYAVTFTDDLVPGPPPRPHPLDQLPAGHGEPLAVSWDELRLAAKEMDTIDQAAPDATHDGWVGRLDRVRLRVRDEAAGEYRDSGRLVVDRLLHLVGMVGAGKSTLRDVLGYWATTRRGLRVTIVVGDVAETLAVAERFNRLGVRAAPVLGRSTRERNIARLHRRVSTAGAASMLGHEHPGFGFLSSACPLDALRGLEARRPLAIAEAPCEALFPAENEEPSADVSVSILAEEPETAPAKPAKRRAKGPRRHCCPLWTRCPRHHAARELVGAQVWVATPASLVHSGLPRPMHAERMRYLELVCRMTDLIVVDEVDRVQAQLDTAFAPSTTLVGQSPDSWLDEVTGHKVAELARQGRLQLSAREVDDWTNAVNTVSAATDRLYALLIRDAALRAWITEDYFSAFTLHLSLIEAWFPDLRDDAAPDDIPVGTTREERERVRDRIDRILDRFRDEPLQQPDPAVTDDETQLVADLVRLTLELLHAHQGSTTRDRVRSVLCELVGDDSGIVRQLDTHAARFELTLILAALHHRLNFMTILWQRVEAALNLERTANELSRRPPKDYESIVPESPMGNVLGFQFRLGERNDDGDQSGELRFFRCNGVGRELLLELPHLPAVDGRPGPNVLLMSATSWAGTSSRYHVHADVGAVLRPRPEEVDAILRTTFRKDFLTWPDSTQAIRLSGCEPDKRPQALTQMLRQLAVPDRSLAGAVSMLDQELAAIEDPDRRRILLLVGSYAEARRAGELLNAIPEWNGRVTTSVSDDADLDDAWIPVAGGPATATLRRGDVAAFPRGGGEILVAPLLAVERGHNIVLGDGKAAIGSVYFLARPHPRPDDIALAIQAINDWAVRQVRGSGGEFRQAARDAGTPDAAALAFRRQARKKWNRFLTRRVAWSSLPDDEKAAFAWDQLVVIWQVIGRLVRGGVPARVVFVDAAFSPREAGLRGIDTPDTSLLESMKHLLAPYFTGGLAVPAVDRSLVVDLYEPLYRALERMD